MVSNETLDMFSQELTHIIAVKQVLEERLTAAELRAKIAERALWNACVELASYGNETIAELHESLLSQARDQVEKE